jgi:hypothetical protein
MEKNLSQLAIGGGPASMGVADSSHSDENNANAATHDNEEYESFGEDGAEDSAAEQGKKRGEGEEEEEGERLGRLQQRVLGSISKLSGRGAHAARAEPSQHLSSHGHLLRRPGQAGP